MPTLRAMPSAAPGNELVALYRAGLDAHWSAFRQAAARLLAAAGIGTGWSRLEQRILPEPVRRAGLSMADRRGVHALLNPAGLPLSRNLLRNKILFARHAEAHGLPVPATYKPEVEPLTQWLGRHPQLLLKPSQSSKGRGIAAFHPTSEGWSDGHGLLSAKRFLEKAERLLARGGVVQECLQAHPDIAPISPGALPTLRIITCQDENGEPELCTRILRLGAGLGRPVDNFNAGGVTVSIDAEGRCGAAYQAAGDAARRLDRHPQTGEPILLRAIPDLAEAEALALAAHRTMPAGYRVVGWDVGLSDRGPVLIEGNWNPGTDIVQLVEGEGLDRTRLGQLYRFHLARAEERDWRAVKAVQW